MSQTIDTNIFLIEDAKKSVSFRVQVAQFGDGYKQSAPDGINTKMSNLSVTFTTMIESEIEALTLLIDAAAGWDTIILTAPYDAVATNWRIPSYQINYKQGKVASLSCVLENINEP